MPANGLRAQAIHQPMGQRYGERRFVRLHFQLRLFADGRLEFRLNGDQSAFDFLYGHTVIDGRAEENGAIIDCDNSCIYEWRENCACHFRSALICRDFGQTSLYQFNWTFLQFKFKKKIPRKLLSISARNPFTPADSAVTQNYVKFDGT